MQPITSEPKREIVEDFAKAVRQRKTDGPKPSKAVINFRNEKQNGFERPVELVPIDLLRYRKDNGRIASDVMNHEQSRGPLDEKDKDAQLILAKFLEDKDPEKTDILMKSIEHVGQSDPAIITCDGFLINGNRRKMVLEKLKNRDQGKAEYETMKVVILPGPGDPGGPPTLLEIERLENRYQLQSEGKSEYYGFDRALSIKRKMELGFTLEEQLRDDPRYARASAKELAQAVRDSERDYLWPLECVDRYLRLFRRDGLYGTVSAGASDPEGRWQAFIDYSNTFHRYFQNQKWMIEKGLDDEDIGPIEDAVFKIIRLRHLKGLPKVHMVMRQLPKVCGLKDSRKEVSKISDEVDATLPKKDCYDSNNEPLPFDKVDEVWAGRSQQSIIHRLKRALDYLESSQEKETPIALLEGAYRKLTHESMKVSSIAISDLPRARQLAADIQKKAHTLEAEIYHSSKEAQELVHKK
jgi:hypothetical protein